MTIVIGIILSGLLAGAAASQPQLKPVAVKGK